MFCWIDSSFDNRTAAKNKTLLFLFKETNQDDQNVYCYTKLFFVLIATRLFSEDHFFDSNFFDSHISDKRMGIPYFRHGHISDMDIFPTWTYFRHGHISNTQCGGAGGGSPLINYNKWKDTQCGSWDQQSI
jgi:hypothetical protein